MMGFNMLKRKRYLEDIQKYWKDFPITALLGPRQAGKTTLALQCAREWYEGEFPRTHYFDLEDPLSLSRLENPMLALKDLRGLIIIDEIQRMPELFPILRVLADRQNKEAHFLILGSASLELTKNSSESLAGRIRYIEIMPFSLDEIDKKDVKILWSRGGFPSSLLARSETLSSEWREQYIRTYLERDLPQLGISIPSTGMRRFWTMLTHYHGQIVNISELGRSLDISDTTVRRYLDLLSGSFMVRRLQAWYENLGKRQVKNPKIYIRDSGIFHHLLGVQDFAQLNLHPKIGASWEAFALEQILAIFHLRSEEAYFWAVHQQAELDLFFMWKGKRLGFEFKYTDKPSLSHSMKQAMEQLRLEALFIVHPGELSFPLDEKIKALSIFEIENLKNLL